MMWIWLISSSHHQKNQLTIRNDLHYREFENRWVFFSFSHSLLTSSIYLIFINFFYPPLTPLSHSSLVMLKGRKKASEMRKFSDPWNDINLSLTRIDDTDFALYSQSFVTVCSKKNKVECRWANKSKRKARKKAKLFTL